MLTHGSALQCWNSELPELAAAHQYKAIFITGSHYSAYVDLPWINNLVTWLHDFVIEQEAATKIVAVCFGCQVTLHRKLSMACQVLSAYCRLLPSLLE